jgi:membrane-anchored protein YejM (alkaline phosphatase superfamily)
VSAQFIYTLEEKLADRFLQAFYLDSVANPFDLVTKPVGWLEDHKRMDQLLTLLSQNKGPVFAHVHLMGTHGGRFFIEEPKYSLGQEQYNKWLVDFYDDSILAFDRYIGELIKYLKTNGQYDHTLLIIYSDHPMNWNIRGRIPLILHFPGDQNAGVITYNTQHLDIAPTILDYMGQDIPDWMTGRSLLSGNPGTVRMIYSAARGDVTQDHTDLGHDEGHRGGPPFYQFDAIQVAVCDHWYELDLWTRVWQSGLVDRHTAPCVESDLPSKDEVVQSIIELLASQGYDVSSLR